MTEESQPQKIEYMPPKTGSKLYIAIAVLVIILVGIAGWIFINNRKAGSPLSTGGNTGNNTSLFDFQTAIFTGKITKIEGKKIWLENKYGVTGEAMISDNVTITDVSAGGIATPSADLNKVKVDKDVSINFQVINGQYQATSINYLSSNGVISIPTAPNSSLAPQPSLDTKPPTTTPLGLPTASGASSIKPSAKP